MKLLLDTHVWLWMVTDPARLRDEVREILRNPASVLYLSAASALELSIKFRLGKLPMPEPPEDFLPPRLIRDRVTVLPVDLSHALRVATLPDHHRDPFDRLLVAQCQIESVPICTVDGVFDMYQVEVIRA